MAPITITGREFSRRVGKSKLAAKDGAVVITDRGRPAYVLMTFADFQRLTLKGMSLAEALAGPDEFDFDFEPPRLRDDILKPIEFD
jgi:prevent-host-death family protein